MAENRGGHEVGRGLHEPARPVLCLGVVGALIPLVRLAHWLQILRHAEAVRLFIAPLGKVGAFGKGTRAVRYVLKHDTVDIEA